MKRSFSILLFILSLIVLASCSSNDSTSSEANNKEENKEDKSLQQPGDSKEKQEWSQDHMPLPTSFSESAEYPLAGEFAGEKYEKDFEGQEEIREKLDQLPKLTEESSPEEIEKMERYVFSLFKEDLEKVDVPIDQWKSMQFTDPDGQTDELRLKENYNVAILLDSSGSMENLEDGKTRMVLAKSAIQDFVKELPENANISLRVYGHVGTGSDEDKKASCSKIEEVFPVGRYDQEKFSNALNQFKPSGWTPMAKAIEQVNQDFKQYDGEQNTNIIYVVSDGVETCNGDPVKAARSLGESNIKPVLNIIGYQVDNEGLAQLKEMAEVSGGNYINAKSHQDLVTEFNQTVDMAKVWSQWNEDSTKALNDLHNTIKTQLDDWYNRQKEQIEREHSNLEAAVNYLDSQEKLDDTVFLDTIDQYRDYFLKIDDEARKQFLDLYDINTDNFLEKHDEVTDRFLEAVN